MQQTMKLSMTNMRQNPPPNLPNGFFDAVEREIGNPATLNQLVEQLIPVYQKHYTSAELEQLIAFYDTPIGRKMLEVAPMVSAESIQIGREWGRQLGEKVARQLIEEGAKKQ